VRAREAQGDYEHDRIAEIEAKVLAGEIPADVARVVIASKQWRASKLAPKKYGDKSEVSVNTTIDVADRIIARWKVNLARLSAEEPLTIEGEKVDVRPE
jgi:hypothetical protein